MKLNTCPAVICIYGPTAAGKTALSIELAKQLDGEIISVDSALIYRGMDIGTAKPSLEEQCSVPHHLLDIINPDESYSVAQFCEDATSIIRQIQQRGNIPLLVGGTMMYFNALQEGLAPLPQANERIRAQISTEAAEMGWPALHARLQTVDPVTAEKLKPQDQQRIQRALEVYIITGTPLSALLQQTHSPDDFNYVNILLMPLRRKWLHERIARRFAQMMEQGFLQEVSAVLAQWPEAKDKPAFRMVGYRQAIEYLQHQDLVLLSEKAVAATRQLAKRQLTWIRHWPEGIFIDPESSNLQTLVRAQFR